MISIPLHKENFQRLPKDLQAGEKVIVCPVMFNIGINEHATIAERQVDKSSSVSFFFRLRKSRFIKSFIFIVISVQAVFKFYVLFFQ